MRVFQIIVGFALAAAYCPAIVGGTATPRWLLLAAVVPIALIATALAGRMVEITWAHILGGLFLAWSAVSLAWSAAPYDSVDTLWKLALLGGCFALGSMVDDTRSLLTGLALGLAVSSGLVLVEYASGWHLPAVEWPTGEYAALFGNRNYLGEAAVLVLIGLVASEGLPDAHIWPPAAWLALVAGLLPALVLSASRGAWAGLVVAICIGLWSRGHRRQALITFIVVAAMIGFAVWWSSHSIADRFNIWRDAMAGLSWLGSGIGTFGATIATHAHLTDPASIRNTHAHNEPLEIAYELGPVGLLLAVAFVVSVLRSGHPARFVFIAFLVEGFFAFPSALPVTGAIGAFMAGRAVRDLPRVRIEAFLGRCLARAGPID